MKQMRNGLRKIIDMCDEKGRNVEAEGFVYLSFSVL